MTDGHADSEAPTEYVHDPTKVEVLAQLVDAACEGVSDIHDVGQVIGKLTAAGLTDVGSVTVRILACTFHYMLSVNELGSPQPGARLSPEDDEHSLYPPALKKMGDQVRALWLDLAAAVTHPIALARCRDIVFTLRLDGRNSHDHARTAARAYLACVGGSLRSREQSYGLLRALTIARSVGLTDLEAELTTQILDQADEVITACDDPHAALPLLDAILLRRKKKPGPAPDPRAATLLIAALDTYPQPHLIAEAAAVVRARLTDEPATIEKANRAEIIGFITQADSHTDGMAIRYNLAQAASLARKYGIHDLERDATARLQEALPIEWTTVSGDWFSPPEHQIATFMHPYRHAPTWQRALRAWLATGSPAGSHEVNQKSAKEAFDVSVIRRLMTHVSFGSNDLPKQVRTGDDDAMAAELVNAESLEMSAQGEFLARGLDLIAYRFGIPNQEELSEFLASYECRPQWAAVLATALRLYWVREFTASAHLAVPKVEAAARALLLELNEPVYRAYVGDSIGQFGGLGVLLDPLVENHFDRDWERFLRTFLLSDGKNVRNNIAHGFTDEVDRGTAALALRAAAVMITLTSTEPAERDRAVVISALEHPTGQPPRLGLMQRVRRATHAALHELRR
ncbi:hypothetical protein ACFQ73_02160 [Amycolatopsis japonica]|uniref:DUF7380 domain-containing protein n=1 Tax=Amycolatopsis japonica TaxID=208439 RepID=UPI00367279AB